MRPERNKLAEPPRRIVSILHRLYAADTFLLWFFATRITGTALDFFQSSSRECAQVVSLPFSRSCSAAVNRTRSNSHTENLFDRRPHCEFPFPDRVAWEEKINRMETRNREAVERLLRAENTRRISTKPNDPEARESASGSKVEIARVLIELSKQQMDQLGPEPPRPASIEGVDAIHADQAA